MIAEVNTIYSDHRLAREAQAEWLKNISELQAKHSQALAVLAQVESLIHEYDARLHTHSAEICMHELDMQRHELEWPALKYAGRTEATRLHEELKEDTAMLPQRLQRYEELSAQYAARATALLDTVRGLI